MKNIWIAGLALVFGVIIGTMMFDNIAIGTSFGISIAVLLYFVFSSGKAPKKDEANR